MKERAVITGVGVYSSLGESFVRFGEAILRGDCATAPVRCFDASTFGAPCVAEATLTQEQLAEASLTTGIEEAALAIDRKLIFGRIAAKEALQDSFGDHIPSQLGFSLGMGLEVLFLPDVIALYDPGKRDLNASLLPLPNRKNPLRLPLDQVAEAIASVAPSHGPIDTFVSACAAGTQCIGEAALRIQRGQERIVVAGATDSMINPMGLGCFRLLGALSPRNATDACRPFHLQRDGTIIGEGAAFFVIEALSSAKARGAKIYAEILGFGASLDAYRVTSPPPDGAGARRAMRAALNAAQNPAIGYVNAHGTATLQNDPIEVAAIHAEVGRVPIGATKSQIGHAMAAAGALEIAASLLCFTQQRCPPTLHLTRPDPACEADHVTTPKTFSGEAVLKNSFGFGGQNASLVLGSAA